MNQNEYDKRVVQITDWLAAASKGNYVAQAQLKEAISTSDFPAVFTDIKTAQLEARYAAVTDRVWTKIAKKLTVPNFLPQSFMDLGLDDTAYEQILASNGGRKTIPGSLPNVPEGTEYPTLFKLFASEEQLEIRKNGVRVPFTFEAIINDQWGIVNDLPDWLLNLALDSEEIEVTSLLTDGDGPNDAYFNAGNGNLLEYGSNTDGTAALTRDTLKAALTQANTGSLRGRPVRFSKFALVVPAALEEAANDLNEINTFIVTDGNIQYTKTFTFGAAFEIVVEPWLDQIDLTHGTTSWYVVPFAGDGVRVGLGLGFLTGHDTPELRLHNDTGLFLGGGNVPAREGSFLNDTWQLRLRHIYGGVGLNNGLGTVASNGSATPTI